MRIHDQRNDRKRKASSEKHKGKSLKGSTSNDSLFKKVSEERSGIKEGPKIHKNLLGKLKDLFESHPKPTGTGKMLFPR